MKTRLSIVLALAAAGVILTTGCASGPKAAGGDTQYEERRITHDVTPEERAFAESKEPLTGDWAVLWVNGMGCPLCATALDMQLVRVPGVADPKVDLGVGKVTIALQGKRRPSPHQLGESVKDAGFTLVKVETR